MLVVLPVPEEGPAGEDEGSDLLDLPVAQPEVGEPVEPVEEPEVELPAEPVEKPAVQGGADSDLLDLPVSGGIEKGAAPTPEQGDPGGVDLDLGGEGLTGLPEVDLVDDELLDLPVADPIDDARPDVDDVDVVEDEFAGLPEVDVEDDGPGITEDVLRKVFDAFFTTKPPGQGTGLGLDISQRIVVDRHRGEITATSEPGRTTFTVRLPVDGEGPNPRPGSGS